MAVSVFGIRPQDASAQLHFTSAVNVIELVERGGGFKYQESRLMADQAIAMGRGGVFLNLTDEQYRKLRR